MGGSPRSTRSVRPSLRVRFDGADGGQKFRHHGVIVAGCCDGRVFPNPTQLVRRYLTATDIPVCQVLVATVSELDDDVVDTSKKTGVAMSASRNAWLSKEPWASGSVTTSFDSNA